MKLFLKKLKIVRIIQIRCRNLTEILVLTIVNLKISINFYTMQKVKQYKYKVLLFVKNIQ